jgi:hypothetical protein
MTDIEQRLRAALHDAVDAEEATAHEMLRGVYRRHLRHWMLVAGLAVLAAIALAIPAAIVTGSLSGTPAPATPGLSGTPPPATLGPLPQPLPTKMTGLPMPTGMNFRFLVDGDYWYSTASRSTEAIAGLDDQGFLFTRVPGGWSTGMLLGGWTCPPHCWATQYFIADGSTHATRIGIGFRVLPSNRPGAVWLLSYARTITSTAKAQAYIQLFSTTGSALGPPSRLPAGYFLTRGVGRYLLLRWLGHGGTGSPPAVSVLWDPRSRRIVGSFPDVIDASSDEIAWSPQCGGCHVELLNVTTGKRVTTPIPGAQPGGLNGSFTDGGSLLAVQLPDQQLAVYDTSSRALTVIPGTALNNSDWANFGWLNGSHTLVVTARPGGDYTTGPDGPAQLAYWQPGDRQLRIATVIDPGEIGALQGWQS